MRRVYWLWAAGLLLKGVGASWDVAWHFRYLRETTAIPHIVNTIGGVLCAIALYLEWRDREAGRTGPLLVVITGLGLFLLAMPFDQWWHNVFGLDLTTWSPSHLMLFWGTAIAVFGVLLLYVTDLTRGRDTRAAIRSATGTERAMLAFFVIFFAAALYFPLTYNEYTTIAARTAVESPGLMDPELVAMALATDDPIFHGTPRWLYPVYSVAIGVFAATLLRAWLGRGWALVALAGLSLERAAVDALLGAAGWPSAAIPLQFLAIGIAVEAVWLAAAPTAARTLAGAIAGTAACYAYFAYPVSWTLPVPVGASSWPAGGAAALGAALVALLVVRRGLRRVEAVPQFELRDVRDWVRNAVARR